MKRHFLFILFFISVLFTACDMTGSADYTPEIIPVRNAVNQNKDSLYMHYTDKGGVYRLDTVYVGDTVTFRMAFTGVANNLVSVGIVNSVPDSVAKVVLLATKTDMDAVFLPTSDYAKGLFYIKGESITLIFPFQYVAKKATSDATLTFSVQSDANFKNTFGANTNTISLKIPIVEKKDTLK
ncbi:MAG: hypothetical protein PHR83_11760 [Paludibacter sp.]|nr:hypothetical protein [Paludibacter sp.]